LLQLIPTPIGNIEDITFRSLKALFSSEIVLAEDTRVTKQLFRILEDRFSDFLGLSNFQSIQREFISVHSHNEDEFLKKVDISIFSEKKVAFVTDAGMPSVSDPGFKIIDFAIKNQIEFEVLAGASASILAYVLSGFNSSKFLFWGFLPHKGKEREKELEQVINQNNKSTVLFESPHRILKLSEELKNLIPERNIFIAKELTKKFETRFYGTSQEIYEKIKSSNLKGEWVVVISSDSKNNINFSESNITENDIKSLEISTKQKAKLLSKITNLSTKECYKRLTEN
jgi:16S rRNA (cytidine1402-2'-O)-methyltransferase